MQTESRVWSDSGVEPAAGDEVYAGQERPIAEYDNWAMWAVTKDIDAIATVLGDLDLVDSVTEVTFDTEANRPADSQDGHVYFEVDTGRLWGYRGGTWSRFDGAEADSIGTSELDLSIAPTWTATHQFDGGLGVGAGQAIEDAGGRPMARSVAASGQVTLSDHSATVDTGISAAGATFTLALGVDDPNADCKISGRLFWDDSAGTYKIEIREVGTDVGSPTVNYDVVRVR